MTGDIASRLEQLVGRGFHFAHPSDEHGDIAAVIGVRAHNAVIDIVQLRGEYDVEAMRIPEDEVDIMLPRTVLWRDTGAAAAVLDAMLDLADPAPERAVRTVRSRERASWLSFPTPSGRGVTATS